ncbi:MULTISPECIES: hypothetical protein [Bacillus]|uniref:Group-specific protein n=1 Tax=Bacillus cereus TaxID=1396 RepID=A0ABD4LFA9_BACCE|nr:MULTISPECIES: hypothetical protein [Bacillus]HDR7250368.1 hypothetical protein [Bacillus pacificus]EEL25772.1 hypothetical protein bcere0018_52500 [Bacillus cereus Rock1-15]ETT78869.1 hypothetical protein C175_17269 [Bacillus cereus]KZD47929.1 hypothetical protein B4085_4020 [Bacillus cereus]KZD54206.1 hypothetical protein B4116_5616 [Bacillus cereus]
MDTKTVITIIGSFLAASTAQLISHILTLRREKKNYKKACYQNLYSPIIFKLTEYIRSEGCDKEFHELINIHQSSSEIFNEIMQHIEKNLAYTSLDIINIFQVWKRDFSNPSNKGEVPNTVQKENEIDLNITFANVFFEQFIKINKSLKFKHKVVDEELRAPYFFTHFFLLIKECTRPYSITFAEIFAMYDLIEAMLLPDNNYTERIISIRDALDKVHSTNLYKNDERVHESYLSAYELLYEIVNEMAIISEDRATDFKEFLDSQIQK